ncbi:MAG TPA: hypothetical protein VM242_13215 [Acidimicrobiales bacterium]|nr:hypothetical protein [Acidimicrobiales bacterium]
MPAWEQGLPHHPPDSAACAAGVASGTGVRWHSGNDAAARRHSAFCASVAAAAATGFG